MYQRMIRPMLLLVLTSLALLGLSFPPPLAGYAQGRPESPAASGGSVATFTPLPSGVGYTPQARAAAAIDPDQCCPARYIYTVIYSGLDETIWQVDAVNLFGEATLNLSFIPDEEILFIDPQGSPYVVLPDLIRFLDLSGGYTVIFRTSSGISKADNELTLSYGFVASPGSTALVDVQIGYPTYYSDFVTAISPAGYIEDLGSVTWLDRSNSSDFLGTVSFDLGANLLAVDFAESNAAEHYTTSWPGDVFRRAQWLSLEVAFTEGSFDPETDVIQWNVRGPGEAEFSAIQPWDDTATAEEWRSYEGAIVDSRRIDQIYLPANMPVGRYTLRADAYRIADAGNVYMDSAFTREFVVIFNPWNTDSDPTFDPDVHNPAFNTSELDAYANAQVGYNFYPDGRTVSILLEPFNPLVFYPAIAEIEGVTSAADAARLLRDKANYQGLPSEVLSGRWGAGSYRVNWRNVPAIMAAWDNGAGRPTGQCMDFGALMASFAQAVGIPSRMLTCINCDGWNFHVWNEIWLNDYNTDRWTPIDATPLGDYASGYGPGQPEDDYFQKEVETSLALFTYDARTNTRINQLGVYRSALLLGRSAAPAQASDVLSAQTDQATYSPGETVTLTVAITNTTSAALAGQLQTQLFFVDYAGSYLLQSLPTRTVNLGPGDSGSEQFTIDASAYQGPGQFRVVTTLGEERSEARFTVTSGLTMDLVAPQQANAGDTFAVTLRLTNTLSVDLSDIAVTIDFPSSATGVVTPTLLNIPTLAAGTSRSETFNLAVSEPGAALISAYATAAGGSSADASAIVQIAGPAALSVTLDVPTTVTPGQPFAIVARVANVGGQTARNARLTFSLSDGLTASDSLTATLAELAAGEVWVVTLPATAGGVGTYAIRAGATIGAGAPQSASTIVTAAQGSVDLSFNSSLASVSGPKKITLTLTNNGAAQASFDLLGLSNNPNIGFVIYDDRTGEPLRNPVTLGAGQSINLTLVITANEFEQGEVTIRAVNTANPRNARSVVIRVNDQTRLYLPLIIR